MDTWQGLLKKRRPVIADGAWGTELAKRGLGAGECPERWNLERPDDVAAVARSYVEAGAEIILTNTFGGSRPVLARAGLADQLERVNRRGVEISREAARGRALVLASVGPTGELIEPLGELTAEAAEALFAEQMRAIKAAGADGVVVETMIDLGEARAAVRAAKALGLVVVGSMTFTKGVSEYATAMGVRPADGAAALEAEGADAVGANCGGGFDQMIDVMTAMRPATKLPLWAKANAGLPQLVDGRTRYAQTPAEMADRLERLVAAGARVAGGCCGTTPEHIKALVAARAAMSKR